MRSWDCIYKASDDEAFCMWRLLLIDPQNVPVDKTEIALSSMFLVQAYDTADLL